MKKQNLSQYICTASGSVFSFCIHSATRFCRAWQNNAERIKRYLFEFMLVQISSLPKKGL